MIKNWKIIRNIRREIKRKVMRNLKIILISIFQLFKNYVVERNIIYKYKNEDVKMKD